MNDETMQLLVRLVHAVERIADECDGIAVNVDDTSASMTLVATELSNFRTKGITVFNDCM